MACCTASPRREPTGQSHDDALDRHVRHRFERHDDIRGWDEEAELRHHLDLTARRVGSAPLMEEVTAALGDDPGPCSLDRWLFDWELRATGGHLGAPDRSPRDRYRPGTDPVAIVLPATAEPWSAGASMTFGGLDDADGWNLFGSLLHRWQTRWGATIVASWGTVLELDVASPPTEPAALIELAVEQLVLAPCTTVLRGVSLRDHARSLEGHPHWVLHERP